MFRRAAALTLTFVFATALAVSAAQTEQTGSDARPVAEGIARAARNAAPTVTFWTLSQTPKRPAALPVLYGTYGALQALDVLSTRKALAAGAREGNPLMKTGLGPAIVIKTATGIATVYVVEKTWKKHRVGAIVLMAVINGASAAVVAHNARNARR